MCLPRLSLLDPLDPYLRSSRVAHPGPSAWRHLPLGSQWLPHKAAYPCVQENGPEVVLIEGKDRLADSSLLSSEVQAAWIRCRVAAAGEPDEDELCSSIKEARPSPGRPSSWTGSKLPDAWGTQTVLICPR